MKRYKAFKIPGELDTFWAVFDMEPVIPEQIWPLRGPRGYSSKYNARRVARAMNKRPKKLFGKPE